MFQWNLLYSCELYGDRELNEISYISIFFVITLSNVLQGELLKCEELHQIAKEAKDKFQQMQRDCLMKIDENCAALTEKHKVEVGNYMQQYTCRM